MKTNTQRFRLEWLACFALTALVFWFYSFFTKVPIIHGDESGYLLNAAAFVGYQSDAFSSYYPGYSLPISLAFLGGASPDAAYDRIQAINALLWGCAAAISYLLLNRLRPEMESRHRWLVLAVTLLYPAFPVFGSLALSENLFVPCTLLLAYVLLLQARGHSWGLAALAGLLVGVLALSHPKGVLVGVAAALAMLANVRGQPRAVLSRLALMLVVAAAFYLLFRSRLDDYLRYMLNAKDVTEFDHYPGISEILGDAAKIFTWEGFSRFIAVMSGQALYLVIGSFGIAALGGVWCVRRVLDKATAPDIRAFAVFSLLSVLAVYAFSVFFMKEGVRADHVMYGRYTESVLAPLLMVGALCLPARKPLLWIAVSAIVLGVLVLMFQGNPVDGSIVVMNVTTVETVRHLLPGVLNVTGLAIIGAVAIIFLRSLPTVTAGLVFVLLAYCANAFMFGKIYLGPGSEFRGKQHSLADQVKRDYPDAKCVNYDMANMSPWERNNYQFYLLPLRLDSVGRGSLFECGDLLISSSSEVPRREPDAYLVAQEFGSEQKLWVRRGTFDQWVKKQPALGLPEGGVFLNALSKTRTPGLASGWYGLEDWGVWSMPDAHLSLALNGMAPRSLRIEYNGIATEAVPRTLELSCNETRVASQRLVRSAPESLVIHSSQLARAKCFEGDALILHIKVDPAKSPFDLGMSADGRKMGIGLKQLTWVD